MCRIPYFALFALVSTLMLACSSPRMGPTPSAPDSLELVMERGVELPDGRRGGAIRLHAVGGEQAGWKAFLCEFSGALIPREARLTSVQDDTGQRYALVWLRFGARTFAVPLETGAPTQQLPSDHPLLRLAPNRETWVAAQIQDPHAGTHQAQRTSDD